MKGYLLDTNIFSELRRSRPEARVVDFVSAQPLESLFVSAVTFAEIRFGIELVAEVHKRAALHDWLQQQLRPMFESRVLPVSEDVMFKWRLLAEAGGWAQGRAHLPAARPDHCGDGAAPWAHGRHL